MIFYLHYSPSHSIIVVFRCQITIHVPPARIPFISFQLFWRTARIVLALLCQDQHLHSELALHVLHHLRLNLSMTSIFLATCIKLHLDVAVTVRYSKCQSLQYYFLKYF